MFIWKRVICIILSNILCIMATFSFHNMANAQENHPPTMAEIPDQRIGTGKKLTLIIDATDIDRDKLTFQLLDALPPGAKFEQVNDHRALLTWMPTDSQVGKFSLRVTATDDGNPALTSQPEAFTIEVIKSTSKDLWITKTAPAIVEVGEPFFYRLEAHIPTEAHIEDITITDFLPQGLTLLGLPDESCSSYLSNGFACPAEALGSTQSLIYEARANATGKYKNSAVISSRTNIEPSFPNLDLSNIAQHTVMVVKPKTTNATIIIGKPITPTKTVTDTGNFSQIPIKINVGGQEQEAMTDENGETQADLGENPQRISIGITFSETILSDVNLEVYLNQMPPTGSAQVTSTQTVSANVMLNTNNGASQQLQLPNNTFSWQERNDVSTASFNLTIPPLPEHKGEQRMAHSSTQNELIKIKLVIDAVWDHTIYLPVVIR